MAEAPLLAGQQGGEPQIAPANPFLQAEPTITFQEHHLPPPLGGAIQHHAAAAPAMLPSAPAYTSTFTGPSSFPAPPLAQSSALASSYPPPRDEASPFAQPFTAPSYAPSAPSGFVPNPNRPAPGSGGIFSTSRYQPYFNVDTADVLQRVRLASVPVGSSFLRAVGGNPDLYGPFWICATLVFVSAATGNAVQYLQYQQTAAGAANAPVFNYDMAKVSVSAGVFFSYVGLYPLMLWFLLRSWGAPTDLLLMVTLYGYSLFIFIPISILSVIPIDAVRWPINMAGGVISTACLVFNLRALLEPLQDGKKRTLLLGFCAASQIGLAFLMKLYLFVYRPPTDAYLPTAAAAAGGGGGLVPP